VKAQVEEAMDILTKFYPEYDHVFFFDNAPTHLKQPDDALSAQHMPKGTSKSGTNWGVEISNRDSVTGKIVYKPDGKPEKVKIRMRDAQFKDGTPQSLYYPPGHEREGVFKGMVVILEECGYTVKDLRVECKGFKCPPGPTAPDCCCRRKLFNEPDFTNVETILKKTCRSRGFHIIFLPKFHCELNSIKQCWGYSKRLYRLNPESSCEDHLEHNMLAALEAVPLKSMRKFATRSRCFMDAYARGLNG